MLIYPPLTKKVPAATLQGQKTQTATWRWPFVWMRPARLERATFWFVAKRSIQLSYGREIEEKEFCHLAGKLSTTSGKPQRVLRRPGSAIILPDVPDPRQLADRRDQ